MTCIIPCLCIMPWYWLFHLSSLFVLLLLVRRWRWDGRAFRLPFRGICLVLGYWVCRKVFTHLNHCYRFSLVTFLSVVYPASLWYNACVSIISHVILQPWYSFLPTYYPWLWHVYLISMLSVVWSRVCCHTLVTMLSC